jgi:hypothetical protein
LAGFSGEPFFFAKVTGEGRGQVSAKNCIGCNKLIAAGAAECPHCQAAQPEANAPPPKELRCQTCKRPYSAKLAQCPFCARGMSVPAGPPIPSRAPTPPVVIPENRILSTAVLFGVPLVVGAVAGVVQLVSSTRLGEGDVVGLNGPSTLAAFFLAPALAAGFVRRAYDAFGEIIDEIGLPKLLGRIGIVAAIALVPTALTISGLVGWFNGMNAAAETREIPCQVSSSFHRTKQNDWHIVFTCEASGERVTGEFDRASQDSLADGVPFRVRAARGRLGYWIRTSDPLTDTTTASPTPR